VNGKRGHELLIGKGKRRGVLLLARGLGCLMCMGAIIMLAGCGVWRSRRNEGNMRGHAKEGKGKGEHERECMTLFFWLLVVLLLIAWEGARVRF